MIRWLPVLLALTACAQEGVPSIAVNCTTATVRDCGSIAISIVTSGAQTITPTVTTTIPVSGLPGGLVGVMAPPSATVTH